MSADVEREPFGNVGNFPKVQGKCPACGRESLFLGSGGYITCSIIGCPNPSAVDTAIAAMQEAHRPGDEIDGIVYCSCGDGDYGTPGHGMLHQPEPHVVTTVEELNSLPQKAVVLDHYGRAWQCDGPGWTGVDRTVNTIFQPLDFGPTTVLYPHPAPTPDAEVVTAEQVEAMSRDLYEEEANDSDGFDSWPSWESHDNPTRDIWRLRVGSALKSAGIKVLP